MAPINGDSRDTRLGVMASISPLWRLFLTAGLLALGMAPALGDLVYLNQNNISVALGPEMAPEPFENLSTEGSLANLIDAPAADAPEHHRSPTTHVWVAGEPLALEFDLGIEYDLTTLHFWNYYAEGYDVDRLDFQFFNAERQLVGELLNIEPRLGGEGKNPVWAEHYELSFPSRVQYVSAVLTGSNQQVDFTNIGFTGRASPPAEAPIKAPPTGPGMLSVTAGDFQPQAAIELILDASGSMLQRIGSQRRITVAREVLIDVVRSHIPSGTPVALRVFGHREADSCRTDLEIPLGPLEPDSAAGIISEINAMNLARTPIADSLNAVMSDLKGASGGTIVLVTDGEETCEGDPVAAIESLRASGFDVNLNIVGFAIEDAELAAQFDSWAKLGDGRYFSAEDQDGLSEALESALQIPFIVYDQHGNEVATGLVGGASVELEPGNYSVLVSTRPEQRFNEVEISGGDSIALELDAP